MRGIASPPAEASVVEVVSSGDLVQLFEARWSPAALASHLEAGRGVHAAVRQGFALIRDAIASDKPIGEYVVQQGIARALNAGKSEKVKSIFISLRSVT